ncbi:MAG: hypothetical protein HQ501_11005 [Rhodospirillales bacterium]|nr:hypothetical protein [Rhodospirillales bacterium]
MTDGFNNMADTNSEWVCGVSKNKIQQGYLLAGFVLVSGLALMFYLNDASEDATLIGMVNIGFAAVVFFMTRRSLATSSRLLVLNSDGVWYRDWKGPVVPWNQIANIEISGSRIKAAVRLTLKDPEAVITLLDAADRKAFEKNPLVNMPVLRVPNGALADTLEQIHEKLNAFARLARAAS